MVHYVVEVASKVWCFSLLVAQGTLLNAFLSKVHESKLWWGWSIGDAAVILIWAIALALVWKSFLKSKQHDHVDGRDLEQSPDEIKYGYYAWLVYVIFLCPRVLLIFLNFKEYRSKICEPKFDALPTLSLTTAAPDTCDILLGPNLLKVAVSITPLVYLSLMYGFHNAVPLTSRKLFIQSCAASGALDLFDSIDLLELLFEHEHGIPDGYAYLICFFSSINFFLPTLGLYAIHVKTIKGRVLTLRLKIVNVFCVMAFVNIPNLVLRAVLWYKYDADVSVLIMKNVMCFVLGLYEISEYYGEKPPRQCNKCHDWYEHSAIQNHERACSPQQVIRIG